MNQITELLKAWNNGDKKALEKLLPLVDPELKKIAHAYMRNEKLGHILQTTALVNEALIRLLPKNISFDNRKHFYGFVARRMRQVLVDYVRRAKHPEYVQLDGVAIPDQKSEELAMLDEALTKLAEINELQATIVECRYFTGLNRAEVAELLGLSESKVDREWNAARRWLKNEMTGDAKQ